MAAFVLGSAVLGSVLFVWSSYQSAERALATRDATYHEIQMRFQRDLRLGLHRAEVYDYFRLHDVKFYHDDDYFNPASVAVGTDPLDYWHFPCYAQEVFVVFDFNRLPKQERPSALDNLRDIRVEKRCDK